MTTANRHFERLVAAGHPVGEVTAVDRFIVTVSGLRPVSLRALVMFEDGSKGFVHQIEDEYVIVLHLGQQPLAAGMVAVVQHQELVCKVGKDLVGRVISVAGEPLDGKGPIAADATWPVFNTAPPLIERKLLDKQLETGITVIDSLFPIVRGQRMGLLGDSKAGKTTITTQLTLNQKNTDQVVVYVLIAKRRSDIDMLLNRLQTGGAMDKVVVVVATMFESLIMSYLAPYVGCSIAEYLWQVAHQDTIIIYDDLTSHAQVLREIALLSEVNPGRDSYPGDTFYAHSSLLERAGRLDKSGKCLTSIPIVLVPGGDITAYLPTNIMSMTDGQWILDLEMFRNGMRPALNSGISVTRIGGIGHNARQKQLAGQALKMLADFRQAEEFSHFGSELALAAKRALSTGKLLLQLFSQTPEAIYSLMAQQLMLDILLNAEDASPLDLNSLKNQANDFAARIKKEEDFAKIRDELKAKSSLELKK